ncbi:Pro-apoptotic serine protease NMA111 [Coemansia reversa NRRL 1564]|uniref:Pro-apoptotic serine protease NMA111 n=1 Tax=Coemansia reversa (strain ATCC 12441 / NRRL 1564) TaxID=763665 RepID=A0A2G5B9Y5_COERN|nr:Pro-apoptotic serine protease NMA111 [Coemansia reversa NRRL 1564]|eukprot:PIA15825.1 Pro-apoptotic serine protease NMA111 [Coemansia reversa NRRL 1564]
MAVFYPPNTVSQPTVTETPFESAQWEGVNDKQLENLQIYESDVASWEPTLEKAINSIVSIKAQCVRSFDTETSGTYTATGFVVDAEAGLILSNRHVVNPAPIVAQAIFANYEEVELQPIYRDPVHDFGFFRFNPSKLRFMQPESIRLTPHKAKVGMEIRVVGNDAGEKLSILAGTLARLDRAAPEYGVGEYNDFNTFYLQAASGTSGGSSGSPVLDIYGDAVALNAGGSSRAASSFYLPLNRIVRALDLVRREQPVPRGTIQAEFEHLPYDELRRLGLNMSIESRMRETFPASQGMLAVRAVLPKGPADGSLRSGDIIVAINGQPVVDFVRLEDITDTNVGKDIQLNVCRGSKAYDVRISVQDIEAITPHSYIEVGGGVVNEVSYQIARSYGIPAAGVYVASSGHVLSSANAWRGSVVESIDGTLTPNLERFAAAFGVLHDGSRVPIKYFSLEQPHKQRVAIMNVTTHWHAMRIANRDMLTGQWIFKDLKAPERSPEELMPQTASIGRLPLSLAPADKVWPSLVLLDFHCPYLIDGMKSTQFLGPGLIIDKDRGYIVCDRDTVPIGVGDVYITIAASIVLVGKVDFLHPVYNFAVVKYDPRQIGDTQVESARFHPDFLSGRQKLEQGDPVCIVAVSGDQSPVVRHTRVASRSMVSTKECLPPRFRCINVEGIKLNDQPSCQGGVLCDDEGLIKGLWTGVSSQDSNHKDTTTMTGFDVCILRQTIEALATTGTYPDIRSLDVELWTIRLAAARALGLDPKRIQQIEETGGENRRLLYVLGVLTSETPASKYLHTGDIILEKNGALVYDVNDLGVIHDDKNVELVVLRDGQEISLRIPTTKLDGMETKRVVHWSGALVQEPYRAVQEQVRRLPSEVYVSCTLYGSPANCYGLRPGMWITEVEGHPVTTIDDFISTLEARYVRITVVNKSEVMRVLSLRVDNHYWPPWELVRDPNTPSGWRSVQHI